MPVSWNYDGATTLIATCTGLAASTSYDLYSNDPDSTVDTQTSDGSGNATFTINTIGGVSAGDTVYAELTKHTGDADPIVCHIYKYGTSGSTYEGIPVTWSYDGGGGGTGVVTATFSSVNAVTYTLQVNQDSVHTVSVTGDGTSKTLTYSVVSYGTETSFDAILVDDATAIGNLGITLFAAGASGTGTRDLTSSTPAPTEPGPPGVSLALTDGPLDDPVTWTRIDNIDGVHINSIQIHRGRTTERDKTAPGTVTISGIDNKGVLDPTNLGSPLIAGLVPTKQAAVSLFNPDTGEWEWVFRGHVSAITNTLDPSEKWSEFQFDLVDVLDILNDAEIIPDQAGDTVPQESVGDCFYTGQHVDDRLLAVLADTSTAFMAQIWPTTLLQIASGNVNVQGRAYSRGTSLLQVIDEACDAEYPGATNRFATFNGCFAFRGRFYRFVPDFYIPSDNTTRVIGTEMLHWHVGDLAAFTSDDTLAVPTGVQFKVDKTDLINTALVTPVGITDGQLAAGDNFSSNPTSISDYGPRTSGMSLENLITGDGDDGQTYLHETATYADVTVHNYKDPAIYVDTLTFRNPTRDGTNRYSNTWKLLAGVELSDLVTVTTTHPGGGGFNPGTGVDQDHFIEEITYDLKPLQGDEWDVTLTLGMSSRKHFRYKSDLWTTAPS